MDFGSELWVAWDGVLTMAVGSPSRVHDIGSCKYRKYHASAKIMTESTQHCNNLLVVVGIRSLLTEVFERAVRCCVKVDVVNPVALVVVAGHDGRTEKLALDEFTIVAWLSTASRLVGSNET